MMRYLMYQTACDVIFVWWMFSWFVTRHVLFCMVIASVHWDAPNQLVLVWRPERGHYVTKEVLRVFLVLLVILEVSAVLLVHGAADYLLC